MCVYSLIKKQYYRAMKELSLKKLGAVTVFALLVIIVGIVILFVGKSVTADLAAAEALIITGAIVFVICAVIFIVMNIRVKKSWSDLSDGDKITYKIEITPRALILEIDGYEPLKIGYGDIKNVTELKEFYVVASKIFSFPVLKCEETKDLIAILKSNKVRMK